MDPTSNGSFRPPGGRAVTAHAGEELGVVLKWGEGLWSFIVEVLGSGLGGWQVA